MVDGPQRKAQQLVYMADAVQQSIRNRKEVVKEMNQQRLAIVDDFEASVDIDTSNMSLASADPPSPSPSENPPSVASKIEKKSKTKLIASLRQQLYDCQSALVEIKENANLKYLKLKMDYDDLSENYSKLEALKNQTQEENEALKRKLSSALGNTYVERLTELESAQVKLEEELEQLKIERDEAKKETSELRALCCEACQSKMKASKPAPSMVRSLWSYFHLDEEARATEDTGSTATVAGSSIALRPPPPKKITVKQPQEPRSVPNDFKPPQNANGDNMETDAVEKPQSTTCGDDLEADLEEIEKTERKGDDLEADLQAMEKKMKDDIESMRSEWKRPSKKRVDTRTVRREMSKKRLERTKSARNTLDLFFSQAAAGLEDEEMEEKRSLYSLQQSFRSLPTSTQKAENPEGRSSRSVTNESPKHDNKKSAKEQDAIISDVSCKTEELSASELTTPTDGAPDRRQSFMSMARESFRGGISNLVEEVEDEYAQKKAFNRRLENLRAKSLKGDYSTTKRSKASPKVLRSKRTEEERRKSRSGSITWEDPTKEQDEVQQKIRKEVEAWAAVDMAPIMGLGL